VPSTATSPTPGGGAGGGINGLSSAAASTAKTQEAPGWLPRGAQREVAAPPPVPAYVRPPSFTQGDASWCDSWVGLIYPTPEQALELREGEPITGTTWRAPITAPPPPAFRSLQWHSWIYQRYRQELLVFFDRAMSRLTIGEGPPWKAHQNSVTRDPRSPNRPQQPPAKCGRLGAHIRKRGGWNRKAP
jgi:hypothetical protein